MHVGKINRFRWRADDDVTFQGVKTLSTPFPTLDTNNQNVRRELDPNIVVLMELFNIVYFG